MTSDDRLDTRLPELALLDSCAVQHLETVWEYRQAEERGEPIPSPDDVSERYGSALADEFLALWDLLYEHETGGGMPWLVSSVTLQELSNAPGRQGQRLSRAWRYWARCCYLDEPECWGPTKVSLRELRRAPARQLDASQLCLDLGLAPSADMYPGIPLRDAGDKALVAQAIRARVPAIITTDLRSFWRKRDSIELLGVQVWKPSEYADEFFAAQRARIEAHRHRRLRRT